VNVRLDKWLKVARIFKTRSQATRACTANRITVNGISAKAHRLVQLEDRIEVRFGDWTRILVVKGIAGKPLPKAASRELFEDQSPPRPRLDPIDRILRGSPERREKGKGRPTKKERRQIEDLKGIDL